MSEELDLKGIIKQAILEGWGERCPDFDPTCRTCLAWQFFDRSFARPSSAGEKPGTEDDLLREAAGHLGAALVQSAPTDDQIIIGHIRTAKDLITKAMEKTS